MFDVEVIDDAATAMVALDPVRSALLAALAEPASAASLAARLGVPRQKINYHLRALEEHGLVRLAEQRRWGGLTERLLVATAASYVVSPDALGQAANDPARTSDRLSARYLIAIAARIVREVGQLVRRADHEGKALATLTLDTEIRFRDAAERAAFTADLGRFMASAAARYHDPAAPDGRWHRVIVAAHPLPSPPTNSALTNQKETQ
ncbi:MAG TPA: helix-turn-helix domain-containing protein [Pseudonocardiaceae bacterium]|nr:helix-turn-helix domain-containing protein [Pseudonocardiaceae bacterium]